METISTSTEALVENGVDEDVTYAVIDTFKFSTTVTVGLGGGIERVYCEPTVKELEPYRQKDDFLTGGEVRDTVGVQQPISNSPTRVRQRDSEVDKIALTSENGAKRTYQLVENGAENIILGCLRNAEAVADYLSQVDRWTLIPADCSGTPQFEDYMAAVLITNLTGGLNATDRVFEQYQQRADDATQFSDRKEIHQKDWKICSQAGESSIVPEWNADGYFS